MRRSASASLVVAVTGVVLFAGLGAAASDSSAPAPPSGSQLDSFSQPPAYTSLASERIYFVMPDRYANGDPSNDSGGKSGGRDTTGFDPADIGYFHGGDLKGLTGSCTDPKHGLERIKDLGFNGIWVTPPVVNKTVQGDSAGYHGYWGLDFMNVDPHLGTNQDFADFVVCAHSLGMKVYQDIVVNHTADVIQYTDGNNFIDPSQRPYKDCHGKKFNPASYVTKTFPCLKASNMPHTPFVPPDETSAKSPAWLNDVTNYHNRGDIDFSSCSDLCYQQGDLFGLDDLFTEKPSVMQGLADIYGSWISRFKVDGFRIDTARHLNPAFFKLWVPKILASAQSAGVSDFQMFGEVPVNDDVDLSAYVRDGGLPNVLDFPFQAAAVGFAGGTAGAAAIANRLQDDDYFQGPSGIASTPATFLGNHDMGRAALEIKQASGASGNTLLRRVLLGYDLLYLLRGAPVVYYGDEVGMIGTGGDKQARQDMFPTQVDDWKTQDRVSSPPIGSGSSFDVADNPIEVRLRALGTLRDQVPALSTGATIIRSSSAKVLVVSRIDAATGREYVAAFNGGTADATVTFKTATPSTRWTALMGPDQSPSSGPDGTLGVTVPAIGSVLVKADAVIPSAAAAKPTLKIGPDSASALWRLAATVPGGSPVSVGFAVWRKGTGWKRVAAENSPPYRGFVKPGSFKKKERAYGVAIVRALDGSTALSKVIAFTPRPR